MLKNLTFGSLEAEVNAEIYYLAGSLTIGIFIVIGKVFLPDK
jgi:hypothetical protein